MSDARMNDSGFRLTGRHVLAMLIAFFAVVFAVNATMMRLATSTFSGVESETPYKNGLAYNTEISGARKQAELGWRVSGHVARDADGRATIAVEARDAGGLGISGVAAQATLERPADKRADRSGELAELGGGRFSTTFDGIARGQWDLVIEISRGDDRVFKSRSRIVLQ